MKYPRKTKKWTPLFSNFKLNLIIALLATFIAFAATIIEWKDDVAINVKSFPEKKIMLDSSINYNVVLAPKVELKNLNFFQAKMIQSSNSYFDTVNLFFYLIVISVTLFFSYKYSINNIFQHQFSNILKWTGIVIIAFLIIDYIRDFYTATLIIKQTKQLYFFNNNNYLIWFDIRLLIAIYLIWLHKAFKKAEKLQEEADLTV